VRRTILVLFVAALVAGCGGKARETGGGTGTVGGSTQQAASGGCKRVLAPPAKPDGSEKAPTAKLDPAKTYEVTFQTTCGNFTITLDQKQSPNAAAAFASLAKAGFFDNTTFHRIVPGFVIQGGDPTATGTGGPGFKTVDTPPAGAKYVRGVVAMAKTSAEDAGTAGSQFFVVTGADIGLPPDYAIIGKVTNGMPVVQKIGQLGDASEAPTQPVVVSRVLVSES
jgi:cyclophilin family peptidyl-prolyl cis-trans isomerase